MYVHETLTCCIKMDLKLNIHVLHYQIQKMFASGADKIITNIPYLVVMHFHATWTISSSSFWVSPL